jgi:hypothetical protein
VLGHTNIKMTSNYLKASNLELHDVFERWENDTEKATTAAAKPPRRAQMADTGRISPSRRNHSPRASPPVTA